MHLDAAAIEQSEASVGLHSTIGETRDSHAELCLRVLYVTANAYLRSTTSSLNAIIRHLQPRGLTPVMVFREPGPWQSSLAGEGIPCYFDALNVPGKNRPFGSMRDILKLAKIVRSQRIDLIHCNEHEHFPLLRQVARWTGVPVVVTLHWNLDPGFGEWAFRAPYTPSALQFLSRAQLELSRSSFPPGMPNDCVKLLMSGLAVDDFLKMGGDGRELRRGWTSDDNTIVLGTASAIKPRKHVEDFVRLISRLLKRKLNVVGVIAGGGKFADADYLQMLKDLVERERIGDRCLFVGNIDPVTPFFKAIDISINTAEMEILSMSLCEAQACGKPTLAYAVGGNPEALPDAWCTVPFGDIGELEGKAAALVADVERRRTLGHQAYQHIRRHFDAPVLAERQAAIYREVMRKRLNGATP